LNNYSKNIAKILADKLEMFYVDFAELLEYELVDSGNIITALGKRDGNKYISGIEQKLIKTVNEYENTIITINPVKLFSAKNSAAFKKSSFLVYLQVAPNIMANKAEETGDKTEPELIGAGFSERDKLYVTNSDIVIDCTKLKEKKAVKLLIKELKNLFKSRA